MTPIEQQLLDAIRANPLASQQQLADLLGISRESVAGHIMRLTRKGAILGKGYLLPSDQGVLVIGGANVDLTGTSAQAFQPADSNPGAVTQGAGGVGRNIAENLARLGDSVSMMTLVGDDSRGRFLVDHAQQAGIETRTMVRHPGFATSTYLAINTEHGELLGAIADMAILDQLTPSWLADRMTHLQSAQTLIVEANLPETTLAWLGEQPLSARIVADAVSASKAIRLRPLLSRLGLLKVNRAEAKTLLHLGQDTDIPEDELINQLLALGVGSVLLSLGERGVRFGDVTGQTECPVPECQLISDTGAGDALLAGFVHAQSRLTHIEDQLAFAQMCAALTLESPLAVSTQLSESAIQKRLT